MAKQGSEEKFDNLSTAPDRQHVDHKDLSQQAEFLLKRATKLFREDNLEEALHVFEESISKQKSSQNINDQLTVARTFNNIGVIYKRMRHLDKAMDAYTQSLHIREEQLGHDHPDLIATLSNIGSIFVDLRELEKAMNYFEEAKRVAIIAFSKDHVTFANILNNIGYLRDLRGEFDLAIEDYKTALRIYISAGKYETDPVVEGTIRNIRQVLYRKKMIASHLK